jgi:hypothetical protein
VLNVVDFPQRASRYRWRATRRSPEDAVAGICGLVFRFRSLESKAKRELHDAILLLDLAAQHARQLVKAIGDPVLKRLLEGDLLMIEELLQLAREKTLRL